MLIREYTPADLAEIKSLHDRTGFDYRMPNLDDALFCVKHIVEDVHGGRIDVASELGQGSTFRVSLPGLAQLNA